MGLEWENDGMSLLQRNVYIGSMMQIVGAITSNFSHTVNVEIFVQCKFSRTSCRALDLKRKRTLT